jgi:hypothetical protein
VIRIPDAHGQVRITILLSPVWKAGGAVNSAEVKPLNQW